MMLRVTYFLFGVPSAYHCFPPPALQPHPQGEICCLSPLFSTYPHGHVQPDGASSLGSLTLPASSLGSLTLPEAWEVLS